MLGIQDIVIRGRTLPDGWLRAHYRGDSLPHIGRRWEPADPEQPAYVQRRCHAEVTICDDGQIRWRLTAEDGPKQYFGFDSGTVGSIDSAVAAAESAAAEWMSSQVDDRLLRCPQSGRPCTDGPCVSPWSGCAGVVHDGR